MDELHKMNSGLPVQRYDTLPLPADLVANTVSTRIPSSSSAGYIPPAGTTCHTSDAAIADTLEQMTSEPFPDPMQYWLWIGYRLVPTSPGSRCYPLLDSRVA